MSRQRGRDGVDIASSPRIKAGEGGKRSRSNCRDEIAEATIPGAACDRRAMNVIRRSPLMNPAYLCWSTEAVVLLLFASAGWTPATAAAARSRINYRSWTPKSCRQSASARGASLVYANAHSSSNYTHDTNPSFFALRRRSTVLRRSYF